LPNLHINVTFGNNTKLIDDVLHGGFQITSVA